MVRVFIKGGVWKNSEDEILKAAVMKYGKQQWARVASLLNRKSAKQCKARWNEWLDPSVRKVEWSREEDEKLLHLAKLLPSQWRTIAPLVGRTAAQCQSRYEALLDEAASSGGDGSSEVAAAAGGGVAGSGAPRKLRPGEIDPHPETRPARPDPVDMDEDEIEMLQEARARLANTQGKKAKRKAREKMLGEAKRLADLQKRRELKQAGLLSGAARTKVRGKRRREIDLGVEIPFHKPAPAGFHDVAAEDASAERARQNRLREVDYKKVNEAQYRSRDREAANAQKREEARLRALERSNMQYVVAEVSKKNDPLAQRKRGVLSMPEPRVADGELERVAKIVRAGAGKNMGSATPKSGTATDSLLGDYSDRPLPTPMRTPMAEGTGSRSSREVILREASNLRMLQQCPTPLFGGHGPNLVGKEDNCMAAAAATPKIGARTPSATPMTAEVSASNCSASLTPLSPPVPAPRDQLGLNRPSSMLLRPDTDVNIAVADDDGGTSVSVSSFATGMTAEAMSIREIAREERRAAKRARRELEAALAALPAPMFEYELAAPPAVLEEVEEDQFTGNGGRRRREKDREELEKEEEERLKQEAERMNESRSTVVKCSELPRPKGTICASLVLLKEGREGGGDDDPERMIREEMLKLLRHDGRAHPIVRTDGSAEGLDGKKGKKNRKKKKQRGGGYGAPSVVSSDDASSYSDIHGGGGTSEKVLGFIPEEDLDVARTLLREETDAILTEKRKGLLALGEVLIGNDADGALAARNIQSSVRGTTTESRDCVVVLREEHAAISSESLALRKNAERIEAKLAVRNGGYAKRASGLGNVALQGFAEMRHVTIEESVYNLLKVHEIRGAAERIDDLKSDIGLLEEDEAKMQKRYGELVHERKRLGLMIRQRKQTTVAGDGDKDSEED